MQKRKRLCTVFVQFGHTKVYSYYLVHRWWDMEKDRRNLTLSRLSQTLFSIVQTAAATLFKGYHRVKICKGEILCQKFHSELSVAVWTLFGQQSIAKHSTNCYSYLVPRRPQSSKFVKEKKNFFADICGSLDNNPPIHQTGFTTLQEIKLCNLSTRPKHIILSREWFRSHFTESERKRMITANTTANKNTWWQTDNRLYGLLLHNFHSIT